MPDLPPIDLDGFDPYWGDSEHCWGPPVERAGQVWQEHAYHVEILGWYYHDYLGTHVFVQVWDYRQQDDPNQRWQYMLFLHRPSHAVDEDGCIHYSEWAWAIVKEYESDWSQRKWPSHAEVGADVDRWVTCPEVLRFLIQGDAGITAHDQARSSQTPLQSRRRAAKKRPHPSYQCTRSRRSGGNEWYHNRQ